MNNKHIYLGPSYKRPKRGLRNPYTISIIMLIPAVLFFILAIIFANDNEDQDEYQILSLTPEVTSEEDEAITFSSNTISNSAPLNQNAETAQWRKITVRRGDNLAKIFSHQGLSAKTLHTLVNLNSDTKKLKFIKPRQQIHLLIKNNVLEQLIYPLNKQDSLQISLKNGIYHSSIKSKVIETSTQFAGATIKHSLYLDAKKAGISDKLIQKLVSILKTEIDFTKEIRPGDQFSILYETNYIDNNEVGTGNILAAKFINQGQTITAIRYTDKHGETAYYTPEGRSLRKAFLSWPTKHSHISSLFNTNRKHPILGIRRPHRGVDFAAPLGTPIKASADGVIIKLEKSGGYGRYIKIKHDQRYSTLYAHMWRFQKGLTKGSRVKQGQVIGYVGQSGLASGPHLHYEFHVKGKQVNPLTVKVPKALSLNKDERSHLAQVSNNFLAQLKLQEVASLALTQEQS